MPFRLQLTTTTLDQHFATLPGMASGDTVMQGDDRKRYMIRETVKGGEFFRATPTQLDQIRHAQRQGATNWEIRSEAEVLAER